MSIRTLLILLSTTICLSTAEAQTATNNTREFDFQAVGFGSGETLEVNAINIAANTSSGTAASCTGSIVFRNTAGTTIGAPTAFTLTAGQSLSAHLPFASPASTGSRVLVRPQVQVTVPAAPRPPCALQLSVEIIDSTTNATHVFVGGGTLSTNGRF